jgi:hypothetical protein
MAVRHSWLRANCESTGDFDSRKIFDNFRLWDARTLGIDTVTITPPPPASLHTTSGGPRWRIRGTGSERRKHGRGYRGAPSIFCGARKRAISSFEGAQPSITLILSHKSELVDLLN